MQITWDLFVLLVFGGFTVYGLFIGKNKVLGLLVNLYISLAVVLVAGDLIYNFASNFSLITDNFAVTEFGTKALTMVIVTGILAIKSEISDLDSGDTIPKTLTAVYGFLAAGVFLSATFSFMPLAERITIDSNFANMVYNLRAIFVLAPVALMIGSGLVRR